MRLTHWQVSQKGGEWREIFAKLCIKMRSLGWIISLRPFSFVLHYIYFFPNQFSYYIAHVSNKPIYRLTTALSFLSGYIVYHCIYISLKRFKIAHLFNAAADLKITGLLRSQARYAE